MFETWVNQLGALNVSKAPIAGAQAVMWPDNSGGGPSPSGPVIGRSASDLAACRAYVLKYTATFGRPPVVWCNSGALPPIIPTPPVDVIPTPTYQTPPYVPPTTKLPLPQVPIAPGPIHRWRPRPAPRPVVRRPYVPRPRPVAAVPVAPVGEICPAVGYTRRDISGAGEYQIVRCTAGQPVVIDQGLARVVRTEALARHGMIGGLSGLDDFSIGSIEIPTWSLIAVAGLATLFFFKRR